jgi:UDP:flavonoid glycosyltransferase YjiC (YdhE family)
MRVLFLSTPLVSHVYPMVPLAWALRAAGHEVLIGTTGPALSVASSGLNVIDFDPRGACPSLAQINATRPDIVAARATHVADGLPLLIEATRQYADQMIAVSERWRPDLIVHSQLQGGGLLAAAKLGIPAVEHGSSLLRTGDFYERLAELISATFTAHGLTGLPACRAALDVAPPSMATEQPGAWRMRYIPFNGGGWLPGEFFAQPSRPRIAVTIGTNIMAPNMARLLSRTIAAARGVDAEFVILLSGIDDATCHSGEMPTNARIVRDWLPLRPLLETCHTIVHHGGAGSILAALDAGVTQLIVPSGAPNFLQSDAVRERGVGVTLDVEEVDAATVESVLTDEKLRTAAAEVREEMAQLPPPYAVVPQLGDLAT